MKKYVFQTQRLLKVLIALFTGVILLVSCKPKHEIPMKTYDIVYLQTNDFNDNQNAVLAYVDLGNGMLAPLPGSPFFTKGAGVGNPLQILGPLDSDFELKLSSDGKYLLTVNSGSNTIAVFYIKEDGSLQHVPGSPFPSGGQTPVSIDVSGKYVFVVNKSQDPLHPTSMKPNYTTFTIDDAGKLTPVADAKFETTPGSSPAQVLVSKDKKYVFGVDFLGFMLQPPVGTLRSFKLSSSGILTPVTGTPYILPDQPNGALGIWQHPSGNPLYVGLPVLGKIGIFNIDASSGALTLQSTVAAGKAACWIRTNASGNRMYVLNSADNTVQVFNTVTSMSPVSVQTLELKNSGPGGESAKTSEDFSLHFSTSGKMLYVVCQHTSKIFNMGNYNFLHSLKVSNDGMLSEETEPVQLPVPSNVRPKGSLVISREIMINPLEGKN